MDTQGSLTHIAVIFKFRDVSGPRAKIIGIFACGTEPGGRGGEQGLFYMCAALLLYMVRTPKSLFELIPKDL